MVSLGREQCLLRQLRPLNIFSSNFLRGAPQKGRPFLFTVTFWFTVTFLFHSQYHLAVADGSQSAQNSICVRRPIRYLEMVLTVNNLTTIATVDKLPHL